MRPVLKYANIVWEPHQQYLIDNIEMVQWRAARWVKQDYRQTSSITDMINKLKWSTLHKRRKYSRLITFINFYMMTHLILKSRNIIYLTHCHTIHVYLTTIDLSHLRHQITIIRKASSLSLLLTGIAYPMNIPL